MKYRTKQDLGNGGSRKIPDTYHDEPENWREAVFCDARPLHLRRVKQRVDFWLTRGY